MSDPTSRVKQHALDGLGASTLLRGERASGQICRSQFSIDALISTTNLHLLVQCLQAMGGLFARQYSRAGLCVGIQSQDFITRRSFLCRTYTTSADGVASANTNLALKGIIAVRAMAELAAVKQETSASQGYFVRFVPIALD